MGGHDENMHNRTQAFKSNQDIVSKPVCNFPKFTFPIHMLQAHIEVLKMMMDKRFLHERAS